MSGPQPHSNQWPIWWKQGNETHANMQDARAQSLGHKIQLYESMERMKYGIQQHMFQLWNDIQNGPESCKQLTRCMLDGINTETSEVHYTRGMQSDAQMTKLTPNSPYADPKQWQNGLKWWLAMHKNEAHTIAQKWGIQAQLSNTFKEWKTWEYGTSISSKITCSMMPKHENNSS